MEVRDLIISKPDDAPYSTLKEALIRRTSASEQKRLQQLLTEEELGDRKPSQLYRRMRQLLDDRKLEESILRQLFVQRLPPNVQLVLISAGDNMGMNQLADLADRIVEVATPAASAVHAMARSAPPTLTVHTSAPLQQLQSRVQSLAAQVSALTMQLRYRGRSRDRESSRSPRSRPGSPAPNANSTSADECWYHQTYGDNARRCRQPCSRALSSASPAPRQGNDHASD